MAAEQYRVAVKGLEHLRGPKRKIVFHGVNKSGSLALTDVLRRGYIDSNRANQFFSHYEGIPRDFADLVQLIDRSAGHSFFVAHSLYGAYESRPGEHLLVTQFRHPLPRVLSCYQWLKNKSQKAGNPFPQLEEWLIGTRGIVHSQVAQFAFGFAPGWQKRRAAASGEELLELSLSNIERDVHWFGIAEHFEDSIFCMAALCGLPSVRAWKQDNRNKGRALTTERPESELEIVREVFRWDFVLYDYALETFRRRLGELTIGGDIEKYKESCRDQYKDRLAPDGSALQPIPTRPVRRGLWRRASLGDGRL